MKYIKPIAITDDNLLDSSVTEYESGIGAWSASMVYALGAKCYMGLGIHKIFESVSEANTNHNPSTTTGYWIEVSATNSWKMFDGYAGSKTESDDTIVVSIDLPGRSYANAVSILDIYGATSIIIEVLDKLDNVLWTNQNSLLFWNTAVSPDWYWYFFSETEPASDMVMTAIPTYYDSVLRITMTSDGLPISVGSLIVGTAVLLGETQWSANIGILDFSKKETDEFGVTSIVERVFAKTMSCDVFLKNIDISRVYRALSSVRAKPVVWVGSDEALFDSTIIYGFFKNFSIVMDGPGGSFCNLEIEGLS